MSAETAYLALMLDAPLQSWGYSSRFQHRTTGLDPTKSGVIGLICAAMGIAKGTDAELKMLPRLAALKMMSITVPRFADRSPTVASGSSPLRRMEDFHTVLDTRRASGALNPDPVVTRRQYLVDARFGIVLTGDRVLLQLVSAALVDPVWGVWFGRKSCIPAEPIHRGLFHEHDEALRALIGEHSIEEFTTVVDVERFEDGTDSVNDQPVSFGDPSSSGLDNRRFTIRRIKLTPASIESTKS